MNCLISIPNNTGPAPGMGAPASAFLAEARANPVYGIGALTTFGTVTEVLAYLLPYLQALANQLAADCPAISGVKNKTSPDARTQTLLAEIIAPVMAAIEE